MSGEIMTFPKTWEEYEKYWGFNDSDEVYTNNARLIPSFRVKQWLDHMNELVPSAGRYSKWSKEFLLSTSGGTYAVFRCLKCSMASQWPTTYCPHCGAKMEAIE